jgi:hypothetical protein
MAENLKRLNVGSIPDRLLTDIEAMKQDFQFPEPDKQPSAKPAETEREWIPVMPKKEINNMEIGLRKMEYIHKILCFTGSTKFKDKFWELHRMYTMAGYITLIPAIYAHCGDKVEDWQQKKLFELQIEKIKICDILFVVNVGGYLGESTLKEIDFARSLGKEINWLEKPPENAERLKAGYATIQEVTKHEPPVDNEFLRGA